MRHTQNDTSLSVEAAVDQLLRHVQRPCEERVPITRAAGRVLAQDIVAHEMMPPFARSPYDGYAFRGEDTQSATQARPAVLHITEEIRAGSAPTQALTPGTAAKILTGGPLPLGANATIKYEETEFDAQSVSIFTPVPPNTDVVPAGEDVAIGDVIATRGTVLTPPHLGLLAGLGVAEVPVFRMPNVTIISTGDELLRADEALVPAKIRNSSYYALRGYLEQAGVAVQPYCQAEDTVEAVGQAVLAAMDVSDIVITTGGVSVGDYDVVRSAVERIGGETLFWRVGMKPGSSLLAARLHGKIILGLSGNPAAAVIGLLMVAMPFVHKCAGRPEGAMKPIQVVLREPFQKRSKQRRFIPGRLIVEDGRAYFDRRASQGNGVVSSLVGCDLLGEIPEGSPPQPAGTMIWAYQIGGW